MIAASLRRCCRFGVSLRERTSMGVGGTVERLFVPETVEEMRELLWTLRREGLNPYILGGGCNTIFPDEVFSRPVVTTEKLRGVAIQGSRIYAEAGVRLDPLIRVAIESGLEGLEMFKGIPGTVGGAVVMNAGGSGHEFGELVRKVRGVQLETGEHVELPGDAIHWSYRSAELNGLVITAVELELIPGDPETLRIRARDFLKKKSAVQPLSVSSAGCVFRNPPRESAGKLIEQAGLKGERVGWATVSERHGNFIVNENRRATSGEIRCLIDRVRSRVQELFDVSLELEVVFPEGHRGEMNG